MGGRANFSKEKQAIVSNVFHTVGFVDSFEGDRKVKIILQNDLDISSPTPTFCNTVDTMYVAICPVYDGNKIVGYAADHIYYYKGHYLERSVDLNEKGGAHYHYWKYENGSVRRIRHNKSNIFFDLSAKDLYYRNVGTIFGNNFNLG